MHTDRALSIGHCVPRATKMCSMGKFRRYIEMAYYLWVCGFVVETKFLGWMGRQKSQIKVSFHPWEIGRKIISKYLFAYKKNLQLDNWNENKKIC